MNLKLQIIALYTHLRHEYYRMLRIPLQVFLPSLITTLLYYLIFGKIVGARIGLIDGIDYSLFITPGLVMLAVTTNSYTNTSSSLFSARFHRSVEELLISPMHQYIFLLGYILGGIFRGIIVAIIVLSVAIFFVPIDLKTLPLTMLIVVLYSCVFSLLGFLNGILAKTFDGTSVIPVFIISPLTYLGGLFYATSMLTPFWQKLTIINPMFYMIDMLRHVMIGTNNTNFSVDIIIVLSIIFGITMLVLRQLNKGTGIRN
jgi:ABC-2 type transport system permease protein